MRKYFLKTRRLGFSTWTDYDGNLARTLWGNPQVSRYISASGAFTDEEIASRLQTELDVHALYHVQYWPIFMVEDGRFIGCCGLRPYRQEPGVFELGIHLLPEFWGQGLATEAVGAVILYAFEQLKAVDLFAGHNPDNIRSRRLLEQLGFHYVGDLYYNPTGLHHPSYRFRSRQMMN